MERHEVFHCEFILSLPSLVAEDSSKKAHNRLRLTLACGSIFADQRKTNPISDCETVKSKFR
jgi:hypothetical protein